MSNVSTPNWNAYISTSWQEMPPSAGELGKLLGQEKVRMFCKHPKYGVSGTWLWDCDSVESLNADGWDVYVVLNPTNPNFMGIKPADSDMMDSKMLLVDFDPLTDTDPLTSAFACIDVVSKVTECMLVQWSGRGFQFWYRYRTSNVNFIAARQQNKQIISTCNSWAQYWLIDGKFKADACTSDISRVARWPNTINHKTGYRGKAISISDSYINRPIVTYSSPSLPTPAVEVEKVASFKSLSQIMPRLNNTAANFLLSGVDSDVRSRHTVAYATARNLQEIGVDEEYARKLVLAGAALCTRSGQPYPLAVGDAIHAVRTAYKAK